MQNVNDELLIKFLLKETSAEENLHVQRWISESAENKKHLEQFETIWVTSKNLAYTSTIDEDKAWLKFKEKTKANHQTPEAVIKPISRYNNLLKIAASLFLVAAAWAIYSVFIKTEYHTIAALAEIKVQTLPDGSEVTLNKNSTLSYPEKFEGNSRLVKLEEGEAFFQVTANKEKPFVIEADKVKVTVVGTSFNVKQKGKLTEVIVETGIVEVSKGAEKIRLNPGEKVQIQEDSELLKKEAVSDKLHNYYRSKEFTADNTPLWRVVEILNEAYQANITIQNPKIRNLRLSTTFKGQSLDTILNIISQTFDIKVEKTNSQIVLR